MKIRLTFVHVHVYMLFTITVHNNYSIINSYVSCTTNRPGFDCEILLKANYKFLKKLQSKTLKCGTFNVT